MNLVTFNENVRQYRHRIYGFAFHYLGNADDAADITQEVFIRLWKYREDLEGDRVLGWLLRVTRNACIDAYRKRKTRQGVFDSDSEQIDRARSESPSPEKAARASLFQERLQEALETLKEPHKSIVVLREIHEYKYEEIAETLEIPLNTVKVYLHRARKSLREELGEHVRYDYA